MTLHSTTLTDLLNRGAAAAPALSAPDRHPMSYADLRAQVARVSEDFARLGLGAGDRVAIVLPNGPVMASCFLASASTLAAAPLNPTYRDAEFEFYLTDLAARALILPAGEASPARDVAARLGIRVLELHEDPDMPAGAFRLDLDGVPAAGKRRAAASAEDIGLVLHTSGTTSRPKIVPLSQANLCASATHIGATLRLSSADHCLNIMPLFHIHGLIAAVLASLAAGGQVTCTPGFNAMKFFSWLATIRPSWYTAVPTMHQTILDRAHRQLGTIKAAPLRFIRSSSSSLPGPVMEALEAAFKCPVIESYGMTEAAHQMTSNELPPGLRKAGAVGVAAGPEVRLMDTAGAFVAPGQEGEIVIRGPNVTGGYDNNPSANAQAFVPDPVGHGGPWFRTGDQGVFDADGFLTISGRLKEIINRGGEKIAPREVDDVLMTHPAVLQVVTFAMPHPKLGEEVAAAVVLRKNATATEQALREFVSDRLAAFKIPRTIVFLDEIPKGATGKLQRIGLAAKLGLT